MSMEYALEKLCSVLSAFQSPGLSPNAIRSIVTPGSSCCCSTLALLMKFSYWSQSLDPSNAANFLPPGLIRNIGSDFILTRPKCCRFVDHLDQYGFHLGFWRRVYYARQTKYIICKSSWIPSSCLKRGSSFDSEAFWKTHICTIFYAFVPIPELGGLIHGHSCIGHQ